LRWSQYDITSHQAGTPDVAELVEHQSRACLVIVQSIVLHLETPEFIAFTSFQESKIGIVVEESIALKKDTAYGAYKRAAEADGEGLGN
jgi:hypothetical protein